MGDGREWRLEVGDQVVWFGVVALGNGGSVDGVRRCGFGVDYTHLSLSGAI